MALPPGPRLPSAVQTALVVRDPIGFLDRCRRRHGPVFRVRFIGISNLVYVAEPELARRVFATDRDIGNAGVVRRQFLAPLVGEHSLLCLEGDEWRRHRKLLGPAFHGENIRRYRDEIAAIAAREVDGWRLDERFELRPRMQSITLEVILRIVFGIREGKRRERLGALLAELIEVGGSLFLALPPTVRERLERSNLVARVPRNPLRRFAALRDEVDAILYGEIARRRAAPAGQEERADVLTLLLRAKDEQGRGLTDPELRDELMTLLEAGHETTATALAWAFERLLRAPLALERLRAEIEAGGEDGYLDAVVKETLRSRPVVLDVPRRLEAPIDLGGYEVPAGWYVSPAIPLVHRGKQAFPEPDAFRPERFLGDGRSPEGWIPFGGGQRRCLGSQLALLELRTVIPEVLARVRLEIDDPRPESPRLRHVTLVPARLTRVVARQAAD